MKTIKIKLKIALENPEAIAALNTLLTVIGSNEKATTITTTKPVITEQKPTKAVKEPKEPLMAFEKEALDNVAEEKYPTATLEEIREVLGKKVTDHREKIKAKLTEFDAKNVSVLADKHYDDFKIFLDSL